MLRECPDPSPRRRRSVWHLRGAPRDGEGRLRCGRSGAGDDAVRGVPGVVRDDGRRGRPRRGPDRARRRGTASRGPRPRKQTCSRKPPRWPRKTAIAARSPGLRRIWGMSTSPPATSAAPLPGTPRRSGCFFRWAIAWASRSASRKLHGVPRFGGTCQPRSASSGVVPRCSARSGSPHRPIVIRQPTSHPSNRRCLRRSSPMRGMRARP